MALFEMFGYTFMQRALTVGLLVSLCASLLGVSLVLKRCSMIGDGLSHVGFGALALATVFNAAPLSVALPVVMAAAFLLLRLSESSRIKGDAAIAMISSAALAGGVLIISLGNSSNIDLNSYMFGSILAATKTDVALSSVLCAAVMVLYIFFYNRIFSVTFDESFARAGGMNVSLYNIMLSMLTAVTVVLGMRLMGALLISSLIIFPPLSAMRVFKSYRSVVICSALISVFCFVAGLIGSFELETPTGATVVAFNAVVFIIFAAVGLVIRRKKRRTAKPHES